MKKTFKIATMAILLGTAMFSCKKNERLPELEKVIEHPKSSLSTNELIKFMAEVSHINASEISYDDKEKQFIWRESKTNKDDLLLIYEQHQEVLKVAKENAN
ncbi:MAG TPA: hypothetical protein VK541_13490 [Pedobacter sp.]|uniref:hypothetical protein n=1 Tax=Pedobacter sp. TaxID=1411316 RepID=UPI002C9804F0|nr:hypothetical protein [Pedobacter sp.]HMI03497.1 hypothetical protein [Pedobacter sp.]